MVRNTRNSRRNRPERFEDDNYIYIRKEKKPKYSGMAFKAILLLLILGCLWFVYTQRFEIYAGIAPIIRNIGGVISMCAVLVALIGIVADSSKMKAMGFGWFIAGAIMSVLPVLS